MTLLLLAPRINETGLQLLTRARLRGLRAHTAVRWEVPDELAGLRPAHLYGGPLFADVAAGALDVAPLEPPADWLATLPAELLGRRVECTTLAEARRLRRPAFLKPPVDKLFPARVYPDGSGLPGPDALDDDTLVQISDVVAFAEEYRLFVLDGAVRTASRYAVDGSLAVSPEVGPEVLAFAADALAAGGLPSAVVVDVGRLADGTWAVVEANPAWASGGYACDPDHVLDVVLRAAGPTTAVTPADRSYARPIPDVVR
ncbi:ATP-grasp domain-containing protein [Streptomyces sp. NRRL B-24484]|uniref:ATP-grasp domain-containing protein n=1 Tax=Streptomyces sp. NRRL B-24484 TaxID=1463833 RepID=UPI0004C1F459|nr:ATP-grasp domain-containing protein [Streptomyces sp. NRRL B-24484]